MANKERIGELEDELKAKDRRIEELRAEIDEQRATISKLCEHAEDYHNSIESWCETFDMVMTEDGTWSWKPWWNEHNKLIDKWNALVRDWNAVVPLINHEPRNVGRPLEASEAQCIEVLKLHKARRSLRGIEDDTGLSLRTVRTIIDKKNGTDRTTKKHRARYERIEVDRQKMLSQKRQRRTGDALPRRVNTFL
jgi:uncharacterized coiled-coil protein SlyX